MKNVIKIRSTSTSVQEIRAATAALEALHRQMRFLLPLTQAERRQHQASKIGPKRRRTLENRLVAARQHRDLLPPAFDLCKFERDAAMASALEECVSAIDRVRDEARDTLLALGNRAALAGATAYAYIKVSALTSERLKRTVDRLAPRRRRVSPKPTKLVAIPAPAKRMTPA